MSELFLTSVWNTMHLQQVVLQCLEFMEAKLAHWTQIVTDVCMVLHVNQQLERYTSMIQIGTESRPGTH